MRFISKLFPIGILRAAAILAIAIAVALAPGKLSAQGYGSIVGTVADATGALVGSATVTATQIDTGRKTVVTSAQDGAFVFPTLPPANYSVSVTAPA